MGELQRAVEKGDVAARNTILAQILSRPSGPEDAKLAVLLGPLLARDVGGGHGVGRGAKLGAEEVRALERWVRPYEESALVGGEIHHAGDRVEQSSGGGGGGGSGGGGKGSGGGDGRISSGVGNGVGGGGGGNNGRDADAGGHSDVDHDPELFFVELPAAELSKYCCIDEDYSDSTVAAELNDEVVNELLPVPSDSATEQQRAAARAGERFAARWLEHLAARGKLDRLAARYSGEAARATHGQNQPRWLIQWRNDKHETGLPYDVHCRCESDVDLGDVQRELFVEVKTTTTADKEHFEVSANLLEFARSHPAEYFIARVWLAPQEDGASPWRIRRVALLGRVWEAIERKAIHVLLHM